MEVFVFGSNESGRHGKGTQIYNHYLGDSMKKFSGNLAFLSNMYPCIVGAYSNSEAAYQAGKCKSRASEFIGLDGYAAKTLGAQVEQDNDFNSTEHMRNVLDIKFANPELLAKLIATDDADLVEENTWNDKFWGVCNGVGLNMLSELLQAVKHFNSDSSIEFVEHTSGYAERTAVNATADVTIAFAKDSSTRGEVSTKKSVLAAGKTYIPVKYGTNIDLSILPSEFSLNVAGNGLYTLGEWQDEVDEYILKQLIKVNAACEIVSVVTGGQTGVDEAGAKAAVFLGIPCKVLAPKGWKYRVPISSAPGYEDVSDERSFKARFTPRKLPSVKQATASDMTLSIVPPNSKAVGSVNLLNRHTDVLPAGYQYAGRGTVLGNPFVAKTPKDRGRVCDEFDGLADVWMKEDSPFRQEIYRLADEVKAGNTVNIVCSCKPRRCHTDKIKRLIDKRVGTTVDRNFKIPSNPCNGKEDARWSDYRSALRDMKEVFVSIRNDGYTLVASNEQEMKILLEVLDDDVIAEQLPSFAELLDLTFNVYVEEGISMDYVAKMVSGKMKTHRVLIGGNARVREAIRDASLPVTLQSETNSWDAMILHEGSTRDAGNALVKFVK